MKATIIQQRTIEKFIMSEFVQGNLDTNSDSEKTEYVSRASE